MKNKKRILSIITIFLVSGIFALKCQAQAPKGKPVEPKKIAIPETTRRRNEDREKQIANLRDPKWIDQQIAILVGQNNESYQTLIETKYSPDSVDYSTVKLENGFILLNLKSEKKKQ